MWKRMMIMLTVTGMVFGGIFGYQAIGNFRMKKAFATMQAPPVSVATDKVAADLWRPNIRGVGDVRAVQGVDISAEIAGVVSELSFKSGDEVKQGDVLLKISAEADLAQRDALQAAADLAQTVHDRDRKQFDLQAVSKAVVEADAAELKNRLALVAGQEAVIAKKIIRAPFAGKLGISEVNVGEYLNPGEKIVSLQNLDPVRIDFFLPQQQLSQVRIGQAPNEAAGQTAPAVGDAVGLQEA